MQDLLLSLRLTRRDWRAGELRLLVAALVVAVGAIASVGFFVDRMRGALEQEAAQLLGADLVIGSDKPPDEKLAAEAARRGLQVARTVLFPSMAMAGGTPQLAAVKAVSDDYPLRGRVRVTEVPRAGAGGSCTTTQAMNAAKLIAAKPAQITRRALAKPYTSVRMSPKMYEIGKNSTPAPKVVTPMSGRSTCTALAGPIRFEQM